MKPYMSSTGSILIHCEHRILQNWPPLSENVSSYHKHRLVRPTWGHANIGGGGLKELNMT